MSRKNKENIEKYNTKLRKEKAKQTAAALTRKQRLAEIVRQNQAIQQPPTE